MRAIVLVDLHNKHGQMIYDYFNSFGFEIEWYDPDYFIKNIEKFESYANRVFCIPTAWENIPEFFDEIFQKILNNGNLAIAAKDFEYKYPWTLNNVICADRSIEMPLGPVKSMTGTSGYCVYLTLLSLVVPSYIEKHFQ